jgi:hypothetical protein
MDCDDGIDCTDDTCDPKNGCTYTPNDSICKNADVCMVSKCDIKAKACVATAYNCPPTGLYCESSTCISYQGCTKLNRECGVNSTEACAFHKCDEVKDECATEQLVCGAAVDTTTVLVASVLGTAAVAGIVIACVLVVVGVTGGATVAYIQGTADGGASATSNNPLYKEDGNSASNPLYQV